MRIVVQTLVTALFLAHGGCAPRVLLNTPTEWPADWSGRKLYNTPRAYVYARTAIAAGEADGVANAVAAEFERDTKAKAVKGLVIVNDRPGESPVAGWRDLLRLTKRQQAAETQPTSMPAEEAEEDLQKVEAKMAEAETQMAKTGITLDMALSMAAIPLAKEDIPRVLTLPENVVGTVDWAVILPSRAMLTAAFDKMMQAALKQQKLNLLQRGLIAPMMAIMQPIMIDALASQRDLGVYRALVYGHPGWTADYRREVFKRYSDRKQKKINADMESRVKKAEKQAKASTKPTSQPAGPTTSQAAEHGPTTSQTANHGPTTSQAADN